MVFDGRSLPLVKNYDVYYITSVFGRASILSFAEEAISLSYICAADYSDTNLVIMPPLSNSMVHFFLLWCEMLFLLFMNM